MPTWDPMYEKHATISSILENKVGNILEARSEVAKFVSFPMRETLRSN